MAERSLREETGNRRIKERSLRDETGKHVMDEGKDQRSWSKVASSLGPPR